MSSDNEIGNSTEVTKQTTSQSNTKSSDEARNMRTLRRLDKRRRLDITSIDAETRNAAVKLLLQASGNLQLSNDITFLAVRVFDFALSADPSFAKQPDLSVATAILMAAKLDDVKRHEHAYEVADQFPGVEPDLIVKTEVDLFKAIDYDMYFATANRFLRHFLVGDGEDIARIAESLCLCAALRLECSKYFAEEIANACLSIARQIVNDEIEIKSITPANDAEKDVLAAAVAFQSQLGTAVFDGDKQ